MKSSLTDHLRQSTRPVDRLHESEVQRRLMVEDRRVRFEVAINARIDYREEIIVIARTRSLMHLHTNKHVYTYTRGCTRFRDRVSMRQQ